MDLSIIIPTYNRAGLLKYTLDSLSKEKHPGVVYEVIVVDDKSSDNTVDVVTQEYPDVVFLINSGKGAGAARNTGLNVATGKYVLYLDSDDIIGLGYFLEKVQFLERNDATMACYGNYDFFAGTGSYSHDLVIAKNKYPIYTSENLIKDHLIHYLSGKFIPPLAIIWRRKLLLQLNGHDESLIINQDVDLFFRAIFNNLTLVGIDDNTKVYIRHHSLDTRVGSVENNPQKWVQLLEIRKIVFAELVQRSLNTSEYLKPLSYYVFSRWKVLRHTEQHIAADYLAFCKRVFWPVDIKGSILFRLLALVAGPVIAVDLKYFLLKHD
ncbi:MAG: glycosyltransferase family 2 protein [Taibaiella sp.]|nr:glycosyltransferase family 2 protein [Taibaiella sp.]